MFVIGMLKALDNIMEVGFPGGSVVKNLPASAGDTRDTGSVLGLEDLLE